MPLTDEWSGLATLLANLIEKYASDLGLDDMPFPSVDQTRIGADEKTVRTINPILKRLLRCDIIIDVI